MKKFLIPALILLFVGSSLVVALFLVRQRQDQRSKAAPATTLYFNPSSVTKNPGETFSLEIMADTHENTIQAIELHVTVPNSLQVIGIDKSAQSSLPVVLTPGSVTSNTATIILGVQTLQPAKGVISIATLTLKALSAASGAQVVFDTTTQASGYTTVAIPTPDEAGNVISTYQPASVTVLGGNNQASPTSTPTKTPTPTQGTVDTLTPTPTRTSTPTPTVGSGTPTPTQSGTSATPTKTPTPTTGNIGGPNGTYTPTPTKTPTPTTQPGSSTTSTPTPTRTSGSSTSTPTPTQTTVGAQTVVEDRNNVVWYPTNGATFNTGKPKIYGKAKPNSKVIITIRSEPQTATVETDANGNWSFTPSETLEAGSHTLIASAVDANGNPTTTTVNFTVKLPVTAETTPTIFMATIGFLLLLLGLKKLAF